MSIRNEGRMSPRRTLLQSLACTAAALLMNGFAIADNPPPPAPGTPVPTTSPAHDIHGTHALPGDPGADSPADAVAADPGSPCNHLMRLFDDSCGNNWLADHGFTLSGWISQGFTWNPHSPGNGINGPVTFNDRANEYQLNQLYMIFERGIDVEKEDLQIGGRVDLLFGTDYYFTQALGFETHTDGSARWNRERGPNRAFGPGAMYGLAMPQLYAEVGGNGWSVIAGHFYTIIGYEVVTAPDNFFYSHAYTMQYAEPFTHTGVLASYRLTDQVKISGGYVNGWDSWDRAGGQIAFLGGIAWTSEDERRSLAFSIITGDEPGAFRTSNRTMYSIVFSQRIGEKFTYILQHDHGWQSDEIAVNNEARDGSWYGVNQYLFYDIDEHLRAGIRFEWFRDDGGTRVFGDGDGANFWAISTGFNWNLSDCVLLRPEARFDWSDKRDGDGRPYGNNRRGSQALVGVDLIVRF